MAARGRAGDLDDPAAPFAMPDDLVATRITTRVDVRPWAGRERAAMAGPREPGRRSGAVPALPLEVFRASTGTGWLARRGVPPDHRDDDVFAGVDRAVRPSVAATAPCPGAGAAGALVARPRRRA